MITGAWTLQRPTAPWLCATDPAKAKGLWRLGFRPCKGQGPVEIGVQTLQNPRAFGHWDLSLFVPKGQMQTRRVSEKATALLVPAPAGAWLGLGCASGNGSLWE